jgi:hypothetical protein
VAILMPVLVPHGEQPPMCYRIYNGGMLTETNSTFSGNAASAGGGMYTSNRATVTDAIIANSTNGDLGTQMVGSITGKNNLIDDAAPASGLTDGANGNIVGHPALLGTLGDNGGPTQTFAPLTGSPAIDHASSAVCAASPVNGRDQRGLNRRTDRCSIGALEADPLVVLTPSSGTTTGGNTVRIAGWFVAAGVQVTFGGVAATNVAVVDGTTLTCTAPAHAAGAVDVAVTNTNGLNLTLQGAYTWGAENPLTGTKPSGGSGGSPGSLPNGRPAGSAQGGSVQPLPIARSW